MDNTPRPWPDRHVPDLSKQKQTFPKVPSIIQMGLATAIKSKNGSITTGGVLQAA